MLHVYQLMLENLQHYCRLRHELSNRKQIACQLRTQYVKGIYRPKYYTVTLKYKLRVTQGQGPFYTSPMASSALQH